MTEPFGGEPFRSSLLLVLCNRLLTAAVSFTILVVRKPGAGGRGNSIAHHLNVGTVSKME